MRVCRVLLVMDFPTSLTLAVKGEVTVVKEEPESLGRMSRRRANVFPWVYVCMYLRGICIAYPTMAEAPRNPDIFSSTCNPGIFVGFYLSPPLIGQ